MMGVFCGEGVVVPSRRRAFMLAELHFGHPRVLRMERGVKTFKTSYKELSEGTVEDCVARFVL